LTRWN